MIPATDSFNKAASSDNTDDINSPQVPAGTENTNLRVTELEMYHHLCNINTQKGTNARSNLN